MPTGAFRDFTKARATNFSICKQTVLLNAWDSWKSAQHPLQFTWARERIYICTSKTSSHIYVQTFQSLAVALLTTRFNIKKLYMVLALRWVFCIYPRTDSDFALNVIKCLGFISVMECLQSGTGWFHIKSRLHFLFKNLSMCKYIYIYTHTRTLTYIRTYTHTYIHTFYTYI